MDPEKLHMEAPGERLAACDMECLLDAHLRMERALVDIKGDLATLLARLPEAQGCAAGHLELASGGEEPDASNDEAWVTESEGPSIHESDIHESDTVSGRRLPSFTAACPPGSLPADWPQSIQCRYDDGKAGIPGGRLTQQSFSFASARSFMTIVENHSSRQRRFIDPTSTTYLAYGLATLLVLCHDLLVVPYVVAWDVAMEGSFLALAFASSCFWSLDIVLSFLTAYLHHGRLETRLGAIARRYARTWLVPDLVIVIVDWVGLIMLAAAARSVASLRILRYTKLGRLLRLIGLLKTVKVVSTAVEKFTHDMPAIARTYLGCFTTACSVLLINHILCCVWFGIGRLAPSDTGRRWVDVASWEQDGEDTHFTSSAHVFQYLTSFHWSIAQFTLGAVDILAYNSAERIFSIVCLTMGLVFGTTFISTVSAGLVDQQMARKDQRQKMLALRQYLKENGISQGTKALVLQQAQERIEVRPRLCEEDVNVLQLLSKDLRRRLRHECFSGHLRSHALFCLWDDMDEGLTMELCTKAMASAALHPQDDLFVAGTSTGKAYRLTTGKAEYVQDPSTAPVMARFHMQVSEEQWFCEAALWVHWVHVGSVKARSFCQVVSISADELARALTHHPAVARISAEYGGSFHKRLTEARPPLAPWPTDLEVPRTQYEDLVVGMSAEAQQAIGRAALGHAATHRVMPPALLDSLAAEVDDEGCVLMTGMDGQLKRLVHLVSMRMEQPSGVDGQCGGVLAQVGELNGAEAHQMKVISAACKLPAVRVKEGEERNTSFARLLERFNMDLDQVEVLSVERDDALRQSRKFGVETRYVRVVFHVRPRQEVPLQALAVWERRSRSGAFKAVSGTSHMSFDVQRAQPARSFLEQTCGPVYKICTGSKVVLCTWLQQESFDHYATPLGEKELLAQLRSLSFQDHEPDPIYQL